VQINPEGRAVQGLSSFLTFVALNIVYLVSCIPVVTIGAATSALYEVTIRYSDDESGRPLKDYFPAFARNFRRATLLALFLLVPLVMLVFSAVFWAANDNPLAIAAVIACGIAAVWVFAAFLYAMALVAVYDTSVRRTLKNALLLPAAEFMHTFGIVLIPVALTCITILFPMFAIIVGTIGLSFGAYLSAFLFRRVFERYPAPQPPLD